MWGALGEYEGKVGAGMIKILLYMYEINNE